MPRPDPLSVRYEAAAAQLISRAIMLMGQSRVSRRWAAGIIQSDPGESREARGQNLSRSERAFVRALYRDPRVYHRSPGTKRYSLKEPVWFEPQGRQRTVRIRVFPDTAGKRYITADLDRRSYDPRLHGRS